MPVIDRRTKCAVCKKWMEVGEKFEFESFRFYGVDRRLPVHREHMPAFRLTKSILDSISEQRVMTVQEVNSGGNVGLLRYLMAGYEVRSWEVRGRHVLVTIGHSKFNSLFWYI